MTALTATIRAVEPGVAQTYPAAAAKAPTRIIFVASFDSKEDQAGDQVSKDKHPAYRGNFQVVIEHRITVTQQPDIARHDGQNCRQAKDNEP